MSDTLVIPLPERLLAVYAVATEEQFSDDAGHSAGGVAVDVVPVESAPLPPAGLLRAMGASAEALARLGAASHAVLVRSVGSPGFPPAAELTAYAAAQTIADTYDGVLVDTVIPRIIETPRGVSQQFRLADWVVLPHSPEPDSDDLVWFTTKGMARFGLPELQCHHVPVTSRAAWGAVLTGVAHVVGSHVAAAINAAPDTAFVEVPATIDVTLRDIAAGYSDRSQGEADPALDTAQQVGLAWDPATHEGEESLLSVCPPRDEPVEQWVAAVVATLFGRA